MNRSLPPRVLVSFESKCRVSSAAPVLRRLGLDGKPSPVWRWHAPGVLSVAVAAVPDEEILSKVRRAPGVRRVAALGAGERLAAGGRSGGGTVVALARGVQIGGLDLAVIAGPCSVESERQITETALAVREAGAVALRGGVFKPRSSPYAFGGLPSGGLEMLARAGERAGLPVVTEALAADQVSIVARHADVIQIGSRNMANTSLLLRAGSDRSGKPVLLKRGFGSTVEEMLLAAEYVALGRWAAGFDDPGLILCERGVRGQETETRFSLDVAAIGILQKRARLPVIADPSHPAGERAYVRPLALAAVAAGANGLLVEVHPSPDRAWSDGAQSLDFADFRALVRDALAIAGLRLERGADARSSTEDRRATGR